MGELKRFFRKFGEWFWLAASIYNASVRPCEGFVSPRQNGGRRESLSVAYQGSYDSIRRLVARWRVPSSEPGEQDKASARVRAIPVHSASRVAWLLFLNPQDLDEADERLSQSIQEHCPELREAANLTREFVQIVKGRKANELDSWINRACCASSPMAIKRFAAGLKADKSPIEAALTLPWSNGCLLYTSPSPRD